MARYYAYFSLTLSSLILIWVIPVMAQTREINIIEDDLVINAKLWTEKDNIPHWLLNGFMEDSQGMVWMQWGATFCRFDGKQIIHLDGNDSIFPENSRALFAEDKHHNIWRYLNYNKSAKQSALDHFSIFSQGENKFLTLTEYLGLPQPIAFSKNINLFSLNQVVYINDMDYKKLWTYDGYHLKLSLDYSIFDGDILPAPKDYFWAISPNNPIELWDSEGKVVEQYSNHCFPDNCYFLADDRQLWYYNEALNPFPLKLPGKIFPENISKTKINTPISFKGKINTIDLDQDPLCSYFWDNSIPRINPFYKETIKANKIIQLINQNLPEIEIRGIDANTFPARILKDGTFLSVVNKGLLQIRTKPNPFKKLLPKQNIKDISEYKQSQLVAVLADAPNPGVYQLPPDLSSSLLLWENKPSKKVNTALGLKNNLIIGLNDGSILQTNGEGREIDHFPPAEKNISWAANTLAVVNDSILYSASDLGVKKLNLFTKQNNNVLTGIVSYCFHKDSYNQLWVGTNNGLHNLTTGKDYLGGQNFFVYHLSEDEQGVFWLSTQKGLVRWIPDSEDYELFNRKNGFSNHIIHASYPDSKGNRWLSSNEGIMTFDTSTREVVATYFNSDGLAANKQNFRAHYQNPDGWLFFGSTSGITYFHPDSLSSSQELDTYEINIPYIQLVNNKGENLNYIEVIDNDTQLISLPRPTNQLIIPVHYPHYGEAKPILEWRIKSNNENWKELNSNNQIFLYSVPNGDFTVDMRVRFLPDHQQILQKTLHLYNPSPFYSNFWFWLVIALLLFLAFWYGTHQRRRFFEEQNRILNQLIKSQTWKLNRKNKELEKIDIAKNQLFKNIGHELRTPISLISISVEQLLEENPKNPNLKLREIHTHVKKLSNMVEGIMSLSRIEMGLVEIDSKTIEWNTFIYQHFKSFEGLAEKKKIHYSLKNFPSGEIYVKTDPNKIEHVLNNLISNALKFTPYGGQIILRSDCTKESIEIVVADNGPGILPEDQENIFKRFYQGSQSKDISEPGYGIGLALCKEYIGLLKGKIWVESIPGEGASFFISIPLILAKKKEITLPTEVQAIAKSDSPRVLSDILALDHSKPNILVVEDNEDLLKKFQEILKEDFNVHTCTNGQVAYDTLCAKPLHFDLIISDVMMPIIDGFGLLQKVRQHPQLGFLPFLFVTSLSSNEDHLKALRLGVDAFITKPFSLIELKTRAKNLVNNQQKRKQFIRSSQSSFPDQAPTPGQAEERQKEPSFESSSLSYNEAWLKKLESIVERNLSRSEFKISEISDHLDISDRTLRNKTKEYTGLSPLAYLQKARLDKALFYIKNKRYKTVDEVAHAVGFKDTRYFSKLFKSEFGKNPSECYNY